MREDQWNISHRIRVYLQHEEARDVEVDLHIDFHLRNVFELNQLLVLNINHSLNSIDNEHLPFACLVNFCRSVNKLFSVRV